MKKYVQVGCGSRGILAYSKPIVQSYSDCAELCGVYDKNIKRAKLAGTLAGKDIPVFEDFDEMLSVVKPDAVIITTKDCDHDFYATKAMRAGCDVIVEKPLTTTFEKALEIERVQKETGKNITVTFNCRFNPFYRRIKELLKSGVIGKVYSVHFDWMLDTGHGADYFRRWHRQRENSGSLLVHKSTHHFDLINWFIEEDPVSVNAFGARRFYGHTREERSERCLGCPHAEKCEFYLDIKSDKMLKALYSDCEDADGYFRDRCVFSDEIDIEDNISVNVNYSGGAVMSYTLTAYSPYEGIHLTLNGSEGRMEVTSILREGAAFDLRQANSIKIYNYKGEEITYNVPQLSSAGHGGADKEMRDRIFRDPHAPDPLGQNASLRAGLMSIGIGMAANKSMSEGRRVELREYYGEEKR